jgi:hypothetical protein
MPTDYLLTAPGGDLSPTDTMVDSSDPRVLKQQVESTLNTIPGDYPFDEVFGVDWLRIKSIKIPVTEVVRIVTAALSRIPEFSSVRITGADSGNGTFTLTGEALRSGTAGEFRILLNQYAGGVGQESGAHMYWRARR